MVAVALLVNRLTRSGFRHGADFKIWVNFNPEDGSGMFFHDVGNIYNLIWCHKTTTMEK